MTLSLKPGNVGKSLGLLATSALALAIVFAWPHVKSSVAAESDPAVESSATSETTDSITPPVALHRLQEGNARFVEGRSQHPNIDSQRRQETAANGQSPFATVIGCSDSRAPIETIFDTGVGDLFTIRVAGNICGSAELGSIEYGVEHLNTPILVVLGHTECGAVAAAVTGAELQGNLPALIGHIRPAVKKTEEEFPRLQGKELVPHAVAANVWNSVEVLFRKSVAIRERVESGKLQVIGGIYDLESGTVRWLGEHPEQETWLHGSLAIADLDDYATKDPHTDDHRSDDHRTDDHRSDDHRSDDHRFDDHRSDDHRSDDHRFDDHRTDDHRTDDHRTDEHATDNHRSDDHDADDHRSDDHASDDHDADDHASDDHQSDDHASDDHDADDHASDDHDADDHASDDHDADDHQSDDHQSDDHQSDDHRGGN